MSAVCDGHDVCPAAGADTWRIGTACLCDGHESPLADETFSDAPTPKANDAMAAVAAQGILVGYEDGSFKPDRTVTREEFASVLYRYLKYNGLDDVSNTVTPYMDEASISPENREAVRYLQMKGLMTSGGTYFHPKETMTRLAAVETMYHVVHSDSAYISHVDVERQVIRALNAEYGGMPAFSSRERCIGMAMLSSSAPRASPACSSISVSSTMCPGMMPSSSAVSTLLGLITIR